MTTSDQAATEWVRAQRLLQAEIRKLINMLRSVPASAATNHAVGEWSLGEVTMHLSHAWLLVPGFARGDMSRVYAALPALADLSTTPGDAVISDLWDLDELTRSCVVADPERDLKILTDRIEARAADFFADAEGASPSESCAWLVEGVRVPRAVLTCHLVHETIVHGYDIARAAGLPWKIDDAAAALALDGFLFRAIRALDPRVVVNQTKAAGLRATFDVRVRGGESYFFVFDHGELRIEPPSARRVDCHLSVDAAAMLLLALGRVGQWPSIARGRLFAWGTKPWLALRFRSLLLNP